jgi:hypothetical protein
MGIIISRESAFIKKECHPLSRLILTPASRPFNVRFAFKMPLQQVESRGASRMSL